MKQLDQHIDEMRNMSEHLVPHSFPHVSRFEEKEVDCLKQRTIHIDGYHVGVHFSRHDFGAYNLETLEIINLVAPFLPMYVVCKLAAHFLGSHELSHAAVWQKGRKVYVWNVAIDKRGRPLPSPDNGFYSEQFEDFSFSVADLDTLKPF